MPSYSPLVALLILLPISLGCGSKYSRVQIQESGGITVTLRSQGDAPRGFVHPSTISSVRITHILSMIDVRKKQLRRDPAFHTDNLYEIGEALARALTQANANQEIVITSIRVERQLGLFTAKYLTSFVAYVAGNELFIHLSKVNWKIPKQQNVDIPDPRVADRSGNFKVLASEKIVPVSEQGVSILWRDPHFLSGTNIRFGRSGQLHRRTVLVEDEPKQKAPGLNEQPVLPRGLTPDQLREIADLEERRREGTITETEYYGQRRKLLNKIGEQ